MATDFGLCPTCGAPMVAADQEFCGACGCRIPESASVHETSTAAAIGEGPVPEAPVQEAPAPVATAQVEPPAWASSPQDNAYQGPEAAPDYSQGYQPAPEGYAPVYPPAPQAYAQGYPPPEGYQPGYPPAGPGYPQGYAAYPPYAAPSRMRVHPALLIIGGVVAMAVIALTVLLIGTSRHSGSSGSITFSPSTISCTAATVVTSTIRLPASMRSTDELVWELDGVSTATSVVADNFMPQSDGSWVYTTTSTGTQSCSGASGQASMGSHTIRIMDATGHVLAQGSYTLKP